MMPEEGIEPELFCERAFRWKLGRETWPVLRAPATGAEITLLRRSSVNGVDRSDRNKRWCREGESNPQGPKPGGF